MTECHTRKHMHVCARAHLHKLYGHTLSRRSVGVGAGRCDDVPSSTSHAEDREHGLVCLFILFLRETPTVAFVFQDAGDRYSFPPKEASSVQGRSPPSPSSPRGSRTQCSGLSLPQDPSPGGRRFWLSGPHPTAHRRRPESPSEAHPPAPPFPPVTPTPSNDTWRGPPGLLVQVAASPPRGQQGFHRNQNDPRNLASHQGHKCHLVQV